MAKRRGICDENENAVPPIKYGKFAETTKNLQHILWDREAGINRYNRRGSRPPLKYERVLCIVPNLTIQGVQKPLGLVQKFTPDGKFLLSFGRRSLMVYVYKGVARADALLSRINNECIAFDDQSRESLTVRHQVFQSLFQLRWDIHLDLAPVLPLKRDFCIFLEDGRYVLLVAVSKCLGNPYPIDYYYNYPDFDDNSRNFLNKFFLVDLKNGSVSDSYFVDGNIILPLNQGVSAYGNTIAILFRCRQSIVLLKVVNGKLLRSCIINSRPQREPEDFSYTAGSKIFSPMKQHILSFLYKDCCKIEDKEVKMLQLKGFYQSFKMFERMLMFQMQLVNADTLFIRYENPDQPQGPHQVSSSIHDENCKLYIFYSISEEKVLKVYYKNTKNILYLLRTFCDELLNDRSLQTGRSSSSPANNAYLRAAFDNVVVQTPGSIKVPAYDFNPALPMTSQRCSTTMYLDCNKLIYDYRFISPLKRPNLCSPVPIRFIERETNLTKFRVFLLSPKRYGRGH